VIVNCSIVRVLNNKEAPFRFRKHATLRISLRTRMSLLILYAINWIMKSLLTVHRCNRSVNVTGSGVSVFMHWNVADPMLWGISNRKNNSNNFLRTKRSSRANQ
jgi:hypothetical protein